jgi:hypothetical protein
MSVFTLDPNVEQFLIADQGEFIVDEVRKHWAAVFGPILELLAIIPVLLLLNYLPSGAYWVPLLGALFLLLNALWRMLGVRMDRFVVTNMRVFRVHGILSQHVATMPISRILDISVHTPIIGRIFNYGHFVFESAAQEQGLREIRYVGSPTKRGLTIQRVIQASGLRGSGAMRPRATEPAMSQRSTQPVPPVQPVPPTQPGESTDTAPIDLPWWRSDM